MRKWFVSFSLAVMLVVAGAVAAEEESVPHISDGRLNSADIAAPVIVYYGSSSPETRSGDRETVELWAQLYAEGSFEKVLSVDIDALRSAMADNTEDAVVATSSGYSLTLFADDSLMVSAPADFEGKVYTFLWTLDA